LLFALSLEQAQHLEELMHRTQRLLFEDFRAYRDDKKDETEELCSKIQNLVCYVFTFEVLRRDIFCYSDLNMSRCNDVHFYILIVMNV